MRLTKNGAKSQQYPSHGLLKKVTSTIVIKVQPTFTMWVSGPKIPKVGLHSSYCAFTNLNFKPKPLA